MPVGPGHDELYKRAANSVMVATTYGHYNGMVFDEVEVKIADDSEGKTGRSAARNQLVANSDADWLFFLDADDKMDPEALVSVGGLLESYDAIWGSIVEGVGQWSEVPRTQIPVIRSYEELIQYDATMTLQMGHFVRAEVAKAHPFDEKMDCGEDWKYYLDVWKHHKCIKVVEKFFINIRGQHSTGQRSANGREWSTIVSRLIGEAKAARQEQAA